jgi:hypothetical protein
MGKGKPHILCRNFPPTTYNCQTNAIVETEISRVSDIARTHRPDPADDYLKDWIGIRKYFGLS